MHTVLMQLQALLDAPVPDDPQDVVVAQMYRNDLQAFKKKAAVWTLNFARGMSMGREIQHLNYTGFPKGRRGSEALKLAKGDKTGALTYQGQ